MLRVDEADQLGKPTEHAAGLPLVIVGFHVDPFASEVVDHVTGVLPVKGQDIPSGLLAGLFVVVNEETSQVVTPFFFEYPLHPDFLKAAKALAASLPLG